MLLTGSVEETRRLGEALGRRLWPGAIVALAGPLGAGKTSLTQGIALGLGFRGLVPSPTFILIAQHELPPGGPVALYHVDLFRLEDPGQIVDAGLEDLLWGEGVTVIEWADRLPAGLLPPEQLWVELSFHPRGRRLTLRPRGQRYGRLVTALLRELNRGPS